MFDIDAMIAVKLQGMIAHEAANVATDIVTRTIDRSARIDIAPSEDVVTATIHM